MSSSGDYTKMLYSKRPSDSGLVKEGPFAFINGRISSTKNRPSITPNPLQRQYVIETPSDRIKFKSKDPTKTATDFYSSSTKKRSSSNERDLWSRYGMKSGSSSKKTRDKDDRRASSALRGSSLLRSRIERDISMSEDAQELFDDGILEEAPLKPNNQVVQGRSKRFLLESDMNREDFDNAYPTFNSPDRNTKENRNGRYENKVLANNGPNYGIFKPKMSYNTSNRVEQPIEFSRGSFSGFPAENERTQQSQQHLAQVKPRDKTPIRLNFNAPNHTPQFSEKKIPTGEERKKRINALERYVDNSQLDNSKLSSSESRKKLDESFQQEEKQRKLQEGEPNLPPNGGMRQNFRKNLYTKNHNPEDAKINDSAVELKPKDRKLGMQSQLLTSFDKDFERLQNEQVDVEEIHYFFVNFHQKSKLILSRMK